VALALVAAACFLSPAACCRIASKSLCTVARTLRIPGQHANFNLHQKPQGAIPMPVFDEHKDELDHYETMMGPHRGRLAVSLDLLTNALILVGQHGVYCHTNRDPNVPVMDIRIIQAEIGKAKELIQSVMEGMRAERDKKS
jgi:hypothetical protein